MFLKTIKAQGLAHLSYMLGAQGQCAIIDPRRDVDIYIDEARRAGLKITHILETHIHADFVSGSRELAARTGALIYAGAIKNKTQGDYGFELTCLDEGDELELGPVTFRVLHTPGHSSEHVSYVVSGGGKGAQKEWAVFTGDTLFAGEVGRPDLEPGAAHEELAKQLFHSLHEKLLKLDDGVEVYPAHGEGSPCGSSIGARDRTTIGYERAHNARLQIKDCDEFVSALMKELEESPAPAYYERVKKLNLEGPEVLGAAMNQEIDALDAESFKAHMAAATVLDTREIEAFAGGHIKGALNIALRGSFPVWAGRMLDANQALLLVTDTAEDVETIRTHLVRLGVDLPLGHLGDGLKSWFEAGHPFESTGLMSVHTLRERQQDGELQIVDVREPGEWKQGQVQGAQSIFLPDLEDNLDDLQQDRPVVVYCGSGFRASIAASVLARHGFGQVSNLAGSVKAWKAAGYPLSSKQEPS